MSGLSYQTVDVKFTQGTDTKTQSKLVVPGKWTNLVNLSLSDEYTLKTRDGHQVLLSTASGNGLATYNNQLLTIAGPTVSSISTATATPLAIANAGKYGFVGVSKEEIRRSTTMQDTPDCSSGAGFTCYAWREKSAANVTTGINCSVVDDTTGTQVLANTVLRANAAVFGARVVFVDDAFFIFYIQGTSLYCRVIGTGTPTTVGAEVALITSASLAQINFDACAFGNGVMVTYGWNDGVTSVRTIQVTRTALVPSIALGPTNLFAEADVPVAVVTAMCCEAFSSGTEAGAFVTSTGAAALAGLAGAVIDDTWTVTTAGTVLDATTGATFGNCHLCACQDSTFLRVFRDFVSEWTTNALNNIRAVVVNSVLGTSGAANVIPSATFGVGVGSRGPQGPFIHGKPFEWSGRVFLPVYVAGVYTNMGLATSNPRTQNTQNTFFVLDTGASGVVGSGVVVGKALYGSYGVASINGVAPTIGTPCSSPGNISGEFTTVSGELTQLVLTSTAINVSPTGLVKLTMTPNVLNPPIYSQIGETTYLAGGSLTAFDGVNVTEHGFPLFPEGVQITVNGAGTGAMSAGVHQVVFVYEWVDNAGQRHQSAPSPAVSVTVLATGSLTCSIPALLLSQKSGIYVVPYMTQASGLTFTRVLLNNGAYAPLANTTAANAVTFTIDDSDTTIAGNELLYTQPNQGDSALANIAPGPCTGVWTAQNRLWFDKSDKPGWFGFSQPYVNNVGLQFSPDLEMALPVDSGGFVAGAAMDEKIIIFGRRRIYVVYGTGPQASGAFNNYSEPQDIQADVGCSEALSVMSQVPGGIIFKSSKGWHVLQRDLSVKYIGDGAALYDANAVTGAVMLESEQQVRWPSPSAGVTLVYSYLSDAWSFYSYGGGYAPTGAVWWPADNAGAGGYVTIATSGGLNHDASTYDTAGGGGNSAFTIGGTTSWLHLSALEAFQRIRRMYLTMTSGATPTSTLALTFAFDDGTATTYSVNVATADIYLANMPLDLRHKMQIQKCKSMRMTFLETPTAYNSRRITGIQAMALEVGIKRGVRKTAAAQNVG
jgi:hypothetical protein